MINKFIKVVSLMSVLAILSSLLACSRSIAINDTDKIAYVSVACSHMCFDECYGISVSIEGDNVFLSGECFVDGEHIQLNDIKLSVEELKKLNKLCNTLDFSLLKKERSKKSHIFVTDETTYKFYVEWDNGNTVDRSYIPNGTGIEIKDYLFSLIKKYK